MSKLDKHVAQPRPQHAANNPPEANPYLTYEHGQHRVVADVPSGALGFATKCVGAGVGLFFVCWGVAKIVEAGR